MLSLVRWRNRQSKDGFRSVNLADLTVAPSSQKTQDCPAGRQAGVSEPPNERWPWVDWYCLVTGFAKGPVHELSEDVDWLANVLWSRLSPHIVWNWTGCEGGVLTENV